MKKDCRKYFKRISEYLDGDLDDEICHEIETHLSQCPECRKCHDSLQKTIQLCKEMGNEEMPIDTRERLRSTLQDYISRRKM